MIGQICRGSILGDWIYDYVYYMKDPMLKSELVVDWDLPNVYMMQL